MWRLCWIRRAKAKPKTDLELQPLRENNILDAASIKLYMKDNWLTRLLLIVMFVVIGYGGIKLNIWATRKMVGPSCNCTHK